MKEKQQKLKADIYHTLQKLAKLADYDDARAVIRSFKEKDRQIRALKRLVVIMGVFNAIATMPQIYTLWTSQNSTGLSLLSWSYYLAFSIVLLLYGIIERQIPLIATYSTGAVAYALIVLGIIIY